MTNLLNILLMAPTQGGGDQNPLTSLLPFLLIIVVFYFFMIRPQMRKQKELNNFRSSLSKGDNVVTTGGIYGKITEVKEKYVVVEIAKEITVKIDKTAVLKESSDLNTSGK